VGSDSDRAVSSLLSQQDQKQQEQQEEAVNSIDFSHSIRMAWRTINKLTGRSGYSSRLWLRLPDVFEFAIKTRDVLDP